MSSKKRKGQTLEEFLDEAVSNIRADRAITATLLTDLVQEMKANGSSITVSQQCGLIASKYVETLQRSNEQLVKLATLVQKKEASKAQEGLTDFDRENLFKMIKED